MLTNTSVMTFFTSRTMEINKGYNDLLKTEMLLTSYVDSEYVYVSLIHFISIQYLHTFLCKFTK